MTFEQVTATGATKALKSAYVAYNDRTGSFVFYTDAYNCCEISRKAAHLLVTLGATITVWVGRSPITVRAK